MRATQIAQDALELIVSAGVGAVVGNAVKATTPVTQKTYQKVLVGVGSFALTSYVSATVASHLQRELDKTVDSIRDARQKVREAKNN